MSWLSPMSVANCLFERRRAASPLSRYYLLAVLASAGAIAPSRVYAADDVVGFVLDLSPPGKWFVDKQEKPLTGGTQVVGGALVRPAKGSKDPYLLLCLYDGTTLRIEKEQKVPLRKKESTSNRIWAAVLGRYRGRVVEAASRDDELLVDGIVALKDRNADLAPVFGELPDGEWSFLLKTYLPPESAPGGKTEMRSFKVSWESGSSAKIELGDLRPGLFELQVINPRTKRPLGEPVLVLFCRADTHEKFSKTLQDAVKLTESWKEEDRTVAARAFTRALLENLADQR